MSPDGVVPRSLVSIVDDDESVRESLPELIRQFGLEAKTFASAEAFLTSEFVDDTSCLVLDIAMPGMSGTDLWQELTRRRQMIPIVFITASGDKGIRRRVIGGVNPSHLGRSPCTSATAFAGASVAFLPIMPEPPRSDAS